MLLERCSTLACWAVCATQGATEYSKPKVELLWSSSQPGRRGSIGEEGSCRCGRLTALHTLQSSNPTLGFALKQILKPNVGSARFQVSSCICLCDICAAGESYLLLHPSINDRLRQWTCRHENNTRIGR